MNVIAREMLKSISFIIEFGESELASTGFMCDFEVLENEKWTTVCM